MLYSAFTELSSLQCETGRTNWKTNYWCVIIKGHSPAHPNRPYYVTCFYWGFFCFIVHFGICKNNKPNEETNKQAQKKEKGKNCLQSFKDKENNGKCLNCQLSDQKSTVIMPPRSIQMPESFTQPSKRYFGESAITISKKPYSPTSPAFLLVRWKRESELIIWNQGKKFENTHIFLKSAKWKLFAVMSCGWMLDLLLKIWL